MSCARWDGPCLRCGGRIRQGDEIRVVRNTDVRLIGRAWITICGRCAIEEDGQIKLLDVIRETALSPGAQRRRPRS